MRIVVELQAYGATMNDVINDANKQWREFTGGADQSLPHDAEISIERHAEREYKGTAYIRVKVDNND